MVVHETIPDYQSLDYPVVWRVPRLWPDATVVCIGSGPSLTAEDVDYCRGRAKVIAINNAYQLAPWSDVLYACDGAWWDWHQGAPDFGGIKVSSTKNAMRWPGILLLELGDSRGLPRRDFQDRQLSLSKPGGGASPHASRRRLVGGCAYCRDGSPGASRAVRVWEDGIRLPVGGRMRVMVHRRQHARGADMALALMRGFEVTGIRAEMTDDDQRPADVDVACVWGASQRELWTAYAELGIPLLVAEQGYVGDRTHWNALGWNGINGQADFVHDDVPADRWRRYHRASLQPWSGLRSDGYILVIGQVQADNSVDTDLSRWYDEVTQHAASLRQVKFRCHPLRPHTTPPVGLAGPPQVALSMPYISPSQFERLKDLMMP